MKFRCWPPKFSKYGSLAEKAAPGHDTVHQPTEIPCSVTEACLFPSVSQAKNLEIFSFRTGKIPDLLWWVWTALNKHRRVAAFEPFCLRGACPRSTHHWKLCFSSCAHIALQQQPVPVGTPLPSWGAEPSPAGFATCSVTLALNCTQVHRVEARGLQGVPSQISHHCSHFLVPV